MTKSLRMLGPAPATHRKDRASFFSGRPGQLPGRGTDAAGWSVQPVAAGGAVGEPPAESPARSRLTGWLQRLGHQIDPRRRPPSTAEASRYPVWCPSLIVSRRPDEMVVRVELSGMRDDELTVEVYDDAVVLLGDWVRECASGSFCRRAALSSGVDPEQISVRFEDDVLTVFAPVRTTPSSGNGD